MDILNFKIADDADENSVLFLKSRTGRDTKQKKCSYFRICRYIRRQQ